MYVYILLLYIYVDIYTDMSLYKYIYMSLYKYIFSFNSVYLYSPISQITNVSRSALQSVHIDIPDL